MLSAAYLKSEENIQQINRMIEKLDTTKLSNAFSTGKKLFLESGNKRTSLVRAFKSNNRIPKYIYNPPMDLQDFLHGFGDTNIHSLKFFVVTSLLNISPSEFAKLPDADAVAATLIFNVTECLRKKGYIEFVTMADIPYLEEQINPMLKDLTYKQLMEAIDDAKVQYLNGGQWNFNQYGAQGYAFFGTTNKKLLVNSVHLKNEFSYNTRLYWKTIKASHRKKHPDKTALSPVQYLQIFLDGPGKKDATSLKLQIVAYLLKFSIRNNDDEVAAAIINKVIDKLADHKIDPSLGHAALEMKSIDHAALEKKSMSSQSEGLPLYLEDELLRCIYAILSERQRFLSLDSNNNFANSSSESDQSDTTDESEEDNNNNSDNNSRPSLSK